jgi:hypothetical protein
VEVELAGLDRQRKQQQLVMEARVLHRALLVHLCPEAVVVLEAVI